MSLRQASPPTHPSATKELIAVPAGFLVVLGLVIACGPSPVRSALPPAGGSFLLAAAGAAPETAPAGSPGDGLRPDVERSARRTFWLFIALPGLAIGAAVILLVMVLATRARRRKLERGELPEMPPRDPWQPPR